MIASDFDELEQLEDADLLNLDNAVAGDLVEKLGLSHQEDDMETEPSVEY